MADERSWCTVRDANAQCAGRAYVGGLCYDHHIEHLQIMAGRRWAIDEFTRKLLFDGSDVPAVPAPEPGTRRIDLEE